MRAPTKIWLAGLAVAALLPISLSLVITFAKAQEMTRHTGWGTITRNWNYLLDDGALTCHDLQTTEYVERMLLHYRGEMLNRRLLAPLQDNSQYIYAPLAEPDLAAYGCVIVPDGTRVYVESFVLKFFPVISAEVNGVTVHGVTGWDRIKYDPPLMQPRYPGVLKPWPKEEAK